MNKLLNPKNISLLALFLAILTLGLQVENKILLNERVVRIVDQRERNYSAKLAVKLNATRELLGLQPVSPNNFAEVLTSYFESMADVMNEGVLKSSDKSAPVMN